MLFSKSDNQKICEFINHKASFECENVIEEIGDIFSNFKKHSSLIEEESIFLEIKNGDIKFCELAKVMINNIWDDVNKLLDRTNIKKENVKERGLANGKIYCFPAWYKCRR